MDDAGLLQIHPAAPLGLGLVADLVGEAFRFTVTCGKRLDSPDVGDRIDQLAADPCRLRGETLMLGAATNTEAGDQCRDDGNEQDQRNGHAPIDGQQHHHRANEVDDGRHDLPGQTAIDRRCRGTQG